MKTIQSTKSRFETQLGRLTVRRRVTIPLNEGPADFITFGGLQDSGEHIAIEFAGETRATTPLVRVHSECLTGDVFGSGKCDCGEQLREAMVEIRREGGVLVYLRQEGRGIGLYNKLDAYALQQRGFDTYESNRLLGFRDDLRSYDVAAQILVALGKTRVRLLSNNPDKAAQLASRGVTVTDLVPTGVFLKKSNENYLRAKASKTGHKIDFAGAIAAAGAGADAGALTETSP